MQEKNTKELQYTEKVFSKSGSLFSVFLYFEVELGIIYLLRSGGDYGKS